ncbi:MAG: hypothetical protein ACRCT7_16855 [Shewanella sp.]|uniref:hypothetical protein n=1 Tax=Shewanella sp. SNU WT4 TaxID=2590015 RepID=UPI00112CE9C4|nr:hypothetical protein [Shewanella sp. SNU WT4]QDF67390.1 hypothetical protein FJQ87_12445 [Shewanella sp. SNU WT4]
MYKVLLSCGIVLCLSACSSKAIAPAYSVTQADFLFIGATKPNDPEATVTDAGSYCLQTRELWKEDGTTPDGQIIWTKDSLRKAVPCN